MVFFVLMVINHRALQKRHVVTQIGDGEVIKLECVFALKGKHLVYLRRSTLI